MNAQRRVLHSNEENMYEYEINYILLNGISVLLLTINVSCYKYIISAISLN